MGQNGREGKEIYYFSGVEIQMRKKEPFKYIQQKWNHITDALHFTFLHIAYYECFPVNKYILYHFKGVLSTDYLLPYS